MENIKLSQQLRSSFFAMPRFMDVDLGNILDGDSGSVQPITGYFKWEETHVSRLRKQQTLLNKDWDPSFRSR